MVLAPVFPGDNLAGPANHQTIPWQRGQPVRRNQAENPLESALVELLHQGRDDANHHLNGPPGEQ